MTEFQSTVRSREFGETLRRIMVRAGYLAKQMGKLLGVSEAEMSRMLAGRRQMKDTLIAAFLAHCKVSPEERDRILELAREAKRPGWWQQHGARLPKQLTTLLDHEDNALRTYDFQANAVPGLLQTADYARAIISRIVNMPPDEVDERVEARLARARVFRERKGATFDFFLHESLLRLPVGGPEVMSEQLHHLLRMSVRPYITIRVVPSAIGAHAAIEGSFTLWNFPTVDPVVYLESATSTLFLERPVEFTAYRNIVTALAEVALDESQSGDLIRDVAVELYAAREDDDEQG